MANLIPQPWTFYGGLWHQAAEGAPTPSPPATLITSENFESGTLGSFTQVAGTRAAAVTAAPYAGTYALRMNLMGAEPTPDPITGNDRDGLYTANTDIGADNDDDDLWYMSVRVRFDDADNRTDSNEVSKPKLAYFSDLGHGGSETQDALFPTLEPVTGIRSWYANQNSLDVLDGYALAIYGEATGCGFAYDGSYNRFEFLHDRVNNTIEGWVNGVKWLPTGAASIAQAPDGKVPVHSEFRINHIRWFHINESALSPSNSSNGTGEKGGVQVDDFEVWSGVPNTASFYGA